MSFIHSPTSTACQAHKSPTHCFALVSTSIQDFGPSSSVTWAVPTPLAGCLFPVALIGFWPSSSSCLSLHPLNGTITLLHCCSSHLAFGRLCSLLFFIVVFIVGAFFPVLCILLHFSCASHSFSLHCLVGLVLCILCSSSALHSHNIQFLFCRGTLCSSLAWASLSLPQSNSSCLVGSLDKVGAMNLVSFICNSSILIPWPHSRPTHSPMA